MTQNKFGVIFIFSPKTEKYNEVLRAIKNVRHISVPFLIEKDDEFLTINKCIPKNKRYHIFMVDKDNNVILAGNPLVNEKMWDLYKKKIAKLSK